MDTGIQDEHVRALAEYIASSSFQSKFEQFFLDNALTFTDEQEHQLEYTTVYQKFQKLFNEHMESFLVVQGISEKEFEKRCQQAMENDPKADQYLEVVLASMDYDAFFHLMKAMRGRAADERAESKASVREEQDGTKARSKTSASVSAAIEENERRIGSKLTLDEVPSGKRSDREEDAKEAKEEQNIVAEEKKKHNNDEEKEENDTKDISESKEEK